MKNFPYKILLLGILDNGLTIIDNDKIVATTAHFCKNNTHRDFLLIVIIYSNERLTQPY